MKRFKWLGPPSLLLLRRAGWPCRPTMGLYSPFGPLGLLVEIFNLTIYIDLLKRNIYILYGKTNQYVNFETMSMTYRIVCF